MKNGETSTWWTGDSSSYDSGSSGLCAPIRNFPPSTRTQFSFNNLGSPAWPSASAASRRVRRSAERLGRFQTCPQIDFAHSLGIEDLNHAIQIRLVSRVGDPIIP